MSGLLTLARMLGVPRRFAEDALRSDSAARAVLSRRNFFAAGAAMAVGSTLVGGPLSLHVFHDGQDWFVAHSWADLKDQLSEFHGYEGGYVPGAPYVDEALAAACILPPDHQLSICWDYEDDTITDNREDSKRQSVAEWARWSGRGYLCSVDF